MSVDANQWMHAIRATRANPPGKAGSTPERRAAYGAALQQFDELLAASAIAGYASRPLTLFYALSQAGRAIVTAHGSTERIGSHGLAEDRSVLGGDVLRRRIRRVRRDDDALGAVCDALKLPDPFGSASAVEPIEIGATWAALPDLNSYLPEWDRAWRPVLRARNSYDGRHDMDRHVMKLTVAAAAPDIAALDPLAQGAYPTIPPGAWFDAPKKRQIPLNDSALRVGTVRWEPKNTTPSVFAITHSSLMSPAERWLMPAAPGSDQPFVPLTAWWMLLFGLSIFARYHPGLWSDALSLDLSDRAVPLHLILDAALQVLPELVTDALVAAP